MSWYNPLKYEGCPSCLKREIEIRQLRDANEVLTATVSSYQKGTVELLDKIDRYLAAIKELVEAESYMKNAQDRWNEGRANTEQMGYATRRLHAANKVISEIAREGK